MRLQVSRRIGFGQPSEKIGIGAVADGHEKSRAGNDRLGPGGDVPNPHSRHHPLGDVENLENLLVPGKGDLGVLEGLFLHDLGGPESVPPVDNSHLAGKSREKEGLLQSGIPSSSHHDLSPLEEESVTGGAGRHAGSHEGLFRGEPKEFGRGSRRHDHRPGTDLPTVVGRDRKAPLRRLLDLFHDGRFNAGPEAGDLGPHLLDELGSRDPLGKSREVLDLRRDGQLSSGLGTFDHQRGQKGPRRVKSSCQPCRARSQNHHLFQTIHPFREPHGSQYGKIDPRPSSCQPECPGGPPF